MQEAKVTVRLIKQFYGLGFFYHFMNPTTQLCIRAFYLTNHVSTLSVYESVMFVNVTLTLVSMQCTLFALTISSANFNI